MSRGFCRYLGKIVLTFDAKCKSLTQMCDFYYHKTNNRQQSDGRKRDNDNFITKDTNENIVICTAARCGFYDLYFFCWRKWRLLGEKKKNSIYKCWNQNKSLISFPNGVLSKTILVQLVNFCQCKYLVKTSEQRKEKNFTPRNLRWPVILKYLLNSFSCIKQ